VDALVAGRGLKPVGLGGAVHRRVHFGNEDPFAGAVVVEGDDLLVGAPGEEQLGLGPPVKHPDGAVGGECGEYLSVEIQCVNALAFRRVEARTLGFRHSDKVHNGRIAGLGLCNRKGIEFLVHALGSLGNFFFRTAARLLAQAFQPGMKGRNGLLREGYRTYVRLFFGFFRGCEGHFTACEIPIDVHGLLALEKGSLSGHGELSNCLPVEMVLR